MNSEITVRNSWGAPIGWLRDYSDRVSAFHIRKGLVGYYVKSSNLTFEMSGRIFCHGNGTDTLVRNADMG